MASETNSARLSVRPRRRRRSRTADQLPSEPDVPAAQVATAASRRVASGIVTCWWPSWTDGSLGPSAWEVMAFRGRARCGCSRSMLERLSAAGVWQRPWYKAVEAIATGRALGGVNLEVAVDNEDAVRLYERFGYRRRGEPVMDRWEKRLDDGSSQQVDVPSWVMINRLEQV